MGGRRCLLVRFDIAIGIPLSLKLKHSRYTYAATYATQIVAAASFTDYWGLAQVYQTVFFYFVAPFSILFINFAGVFVRYRVFDSFQIALWLNFLVLRMG